VSDEVIASVLSRHRAFPPWWDDVELAVLPETQTHNSIDFRDSGPKRRPLLNIGGGVVSGGDDTQFMRRAVLNTFSGSIRCTSAAADFAFLHQNVEYTLIFAVRLASLPGALAVVLDTTSGGSTGNHGMYVAIRTNGKIRFFMAYGSGGNFVIDVDSTAALVADSTRYQYVRIKWYGTTPASSNVSFEIDANAISFHNKSGLGPSGSNPTGQLHIGNLDGGGFALTAKSADVIVLRGLDTMPWPPKKRYGT
jgi:hypothetical protein